TFVAERPPTGPARGTDRTVACILQYQGPHVGLILAGIEEVCAELGYRLFLNHCEDDPAREERALLNALAHNVNGIIVYPTEGTAVLEPYLRAARARVP